MSSAHDVHIDVYLIDTGAQAVLSCPDCPVSLRILTSTLELAWEIAALAGLWHEGRVLNAEEVAA